MPCLVMSGKQEVLLVLNVFALCFAGTLISELNHMHLEKAGYCFSGDPCKGIKTHAYI
jgi:hypothetical protein